MLIFPMQELLSIAFLMLSFFVFDAEKMGGGGGGGYAFWFIPI
jgi:hypothetical protein